MIHDWNETYLIREIFFQLFYTLKPVLLGLLGYQFNIQKGSLLWSIEMTGCGALDYSGRYIGNGVLWKRQNI